MSDPIIIGVLALQGAFARHIEMLQSLGIRTKEVRVPKDLNECDGLIIPGGESTVIFKQIQFILMESELKKFSKEKPVFGTCAGLILMSHKILNDTRKPFNILNIEVERNAFGRQAESFTCLLDLTIGDKEKIIPGIFIRAPRIKKIGADIEVLAAYEDEPVLIRQGMHLGATFHPELGHDVSIHKLFLDIVENNKLRD